jgi:hypothetical protein
MFMDSTSFVREMLTGAAAPGAKEGQAEEPQRSVVVDSTKLVDICFGVDGCGDETVAWQ